jgi:hypothetical protein
MAYRPTISSRSDSHETVMCETEDKMPDPPNPEIYSEANRVLNRVEALENQIVNEIQWAEERLKVLQEILSRLRRENTPVKAR